MMDSRTSKPETTTSSSTSPEPLFSPSLISPELAAILPESYTIRPMRQSDYHRGFLDCLRVLTTVGDISEEAWNERYEWMTTQGKGGYYLLVIDDGDRVVGTGALIVERKLYVSQPQSKFPGNKGVLLTDVVLHSIHNLGLVGHIEDIAVAKDQQGKKLGLKIIQALDFIAEKVGCYKSILDCSEANEGFYVKCGFKRAGLEMAHYYEQPKST
jgi:glucosamine-phosphate N-acetyltransferase